MRVVAARDRGLCEGLHAVSAAGNPGQAVNVPAAVVATPGGGRGKGRDRAMPERRLPVLVPFGNGIWVFIALLFAGCGTPCPSALSDVSPAAWRTPVEVTVPNSDTLSQRELRVVVRSNGAFTEDTLTVHIGVLTPDSLRYTEPFVLHIPRERKAASVGRETENVYRRNVILKDTGDYRFTFTPARTVHGIEAVGMHIVTND